MSVRKLTASLLMALATIGTAHTAADAQEHFPVADPYAFDPDFRWFEPIYDADLADIKPKKRANTGWFATYDRLNLYASRPELDDPNASETILDSGWGNRYEIGYMLPDKDNGWLFSWVNLDGPNAYFTVERERLNRYNLQNLGEGDDQPVDPRFSSPQLSIPPSDRNTPGFFRRVYLVQDSENVMDFNSFELSKTWRMEPYHYGGILEPMVGFRYMKLNDYNIDQNYSSPIDLDQVPFFTFGVAEQLITDKTITSNDVLTGQVGFRYTKFRDRFVFTSDFRVFTGGSLQSAKAQRDTEITIYNLTGTTVTIGEPPEFVINRSTTPVYTRNEEFVIGFDVRGEVNYQLTKMITLRAGFQLIDLATGIWRGGPDVGVGGSLLPGGDRDQDVVMVGGTFGVTLNR